MDFTDALKAGGASATLIAIVGIAVKIFQSFCGHRLRSECCGREGTVGVSVEQISPKAPRSSITPKPIADTFVPPIDIDVPSMITVKSPPPSRISTPVCGAAPATDEHQVPKLEV